LTGSYPSGYAKLDVDEDELLRGLLGGTDASAERLPQEAENGISDDSGDNGVADAKIEENPAFS